MGVGAAGGMRAAGLAAALLLAAGAARAAGDGPDMFQTHAAGYEYGVDFRQFFAGRGVVYGWGLWRQRLGLGLDVVSTAGPFEFLAQPSGGSARKERDYQFSLLAPRASLLLYTWGSLLPASDGPGRMRGGIEVFGGAHWLTAHRYGLEVGHVSYTDVGIALHTGYLVTCKIGRAFGTMPGGLYTSNSRETVLASGYRERKDYFTVGVSFGGISLQGNSPEVYEAVVVEDAQLQEAATYGGGDSGDAAEDLRREGLGLLGAGRGRQGRKALKRACGLGLTEACEDLRAWDRKDKR